MLHYKRSIWMSRAAAPLFDQVIFSGTTFVSGSIIARSATTDQFGVYSLVLLALAWACNVQGAAVTTPYLFRYRHLDLPARRDYAGAVILSQLAFAAVATCVLLSVSIIASKSAAPETRSLAAPLVSAGIICTCWLLRECCRQLAFAHERFSSVICLDSVVAIFQLGALTVAVRWTEITASMAFAIIGLAAFLPTVGWLWINRKLFRFGGQGLLRYLGGGWTFGKWIVAGVLVHGLAKDSYPWIMSFLHGTQGAASIAAALGIAFLINPLLMGTTNLIRPIFARIYKEDGTKSLNAAVRSYTGMAAVAGALYCAVLFATGDWITTAVYGAPYADAGRLTGWFAMGIAASFVSIPVGVALYAQERSKVTFIAVCVAASITVILGGPLISKYSLIGAAAAFVLANIGETIAKFHFYLRGQRQEGACPATTQSI